MANPFRCTIITPSAAVFDGDVTYANLPAHDGMRGVMAGQSPLLTALGIGTLRIDLLKGGSERYFIDGGFAQVMEGSLKIITERALVPDQISAKDADAELKEANAAAVSGGTDRRKAEAAQQRARVQLALARSAPAAAER